MLRTAGEICYYLGLTSTAFIVPAITLILWIMSLVDKARPNYWILLIAWTLSVLVFLVGVWIKRQAR